MRLEPGVVMVTKRSRTTGGRRARSGGSGEGVELPAPTSERTDAVDPENGDGLAGPAVHGKEAALFQAAVLHGQLVGEVRRAGELDPAPVLVGPEVRRPRRTDRCAPAQQRRDGGCRPLQGAGPVLDPAV